MDCRWLWIRPEPIWKRPGWIWLSYWQIYQQHRADLLQQRGGLVADHPAPVATTWSLSFQRVEEKNPAAADLLRLCAFLAPDAIPEEILTEGASLLGPVLAPWQRMPFCSIRPSRLCEPIRWYGVIPGGRPSRSIGWCRPCFRTAGGNGKTHLGRTGDARGQRSISSGEYGTWPQCERLLPQALAATQLIEQYQIIGEEAERLLYRDSILPRGSCALCGGGAALPASLRIWEQQLGPDHPEVASSRSTTWRTFYRDAGQVCGSRATLPASATYQGADGGTSHPIGLPRSMDLAILYSEQGKYAEAEPLYQRALRIREQRLGTRPSQVPIRSTDLAHLYREQGKYAEAESLYRRALHIREQQLGQTIPMWPPRSTTWRSCTGSRASMRRPSRSTSERCASGSRRSQTIPMWPTRSTDLAAPATGSRASMRQAEPLYQRALRIREQQLGPDHPDVAYPLHGLANLYRGAGQVCAGRATLPASAAHLGAAVRTRLSRWLARGLTHSRTGTRGVGSGATQTVQFLDFYIWLPQPDVAYPLHGLANLYREQGKYAQAEPLYQRALRIWEQQLGPEHPETAEIIHDLARFREAQDNCEETSVWYTRALAVREQTLGAQHPKTTETRTRFVALLHAMEQHGKP